MGTQGIILQRHRRLPVFAFAMAVVLIAAIAVLAAQAASLRSSTGPATTEVKHRSDRVARPHGLLESHPVYSEPQRYDHWVEKADGSYTYYRYAGDPPRLTLRQFKPRK
jgi:archaellum component FlaG (FlaF/FlaG flagellin family)